MSSSKHTALVMVMLCLLNAPSGAATTPQEAPPKATLPPADSFDKNLAVFVDVLGLVRNSYVDKPDMATLTAGALEGATDALDPFSIYVPPAEFDGYLEARRTGWLRSGIVVLKERGIVYVATVEKEGPAGQVGIRRGDIIAKLNDRPTQPMPLWEIQKLLAGKPGTKIDLELARDGQARQVSLVLWPFSPPPASFSTSSGATVLRIPTFERATVSAVTTLLADAAEATRAGLIVDLRGVATGDPEVAYAVGELFADGELGSLVHRHEELQTYKSAGKSVWHGRLVVLVDRGTIGAAEILATVLRQKAGAELVGERTFGHAGRLASAPLSNGGRLFFTEAFYTGPDRKPLNESLQPDLLVSERSRTYLEEDVPLSDLILDRGVRRLLDSKDGHP